jgi:hypothetical protein
MYYVTLQYQTPFSLIGAAVAEIGGAEMPMT